MAVLSLYVYVCVFLTLAHALSSVYVHKGSQYCQCCVGAPGTQGPHGLQGLPGMRGHIGFKGQKGEIASKGDTGPQGPTGSKGDRGKRGRKAQKGECGNRGPKGFQGDLGPYGPKGQKGLKGAPAPDLVHVAFSASRTQRMGPVFENTMVTFDNIFTNAGNGFDPYTSTFVCKTNGTYLFTAHLLSNLENDAYGWIMMNGNFIVPMHGDKRAGYGSGSNTVILHLVKDDHVWVQLSKNSSLLNDYSTFSGYLIHAD